MTNASVVDMSEPKLFHVETTLCEFCLAGKGGECHVPGCALIRNRAPDIPWRGMIKDLGGKVIPLEDHLARATHPVV